MTDNKNPSRWGGVADSFKTGLKAKAQEIQGIGDQIFDTIAQSRVAKNAAETAGGLAGELASKYGPPILSKVAEPIIENVLAGAPQTIRNGADRIVTALTNDAVATEIGKEGGKAINEALPEITREIVNDHAEATGWAAQNLNPWNRELKEVIDVKFKQNQPILKRLFGMLLYYGGRFLAFISAKLLSIFDSSAGLTEEERKKKREASQKNIQSIMSGAILNGWIQAPEAFENQSIQHQSPVAPVTQGSLSPSGA